MRKEEFSLQNQFILNVDLKHNYSSDTPKFRRGDTVVILFNFFDDGEELSLNSATKAMVHQKTSKGNIIESECTFTTYNGKRVVRFEVEDIAMVEIGYLNLLLTVWRDKDVISIQPFNVLIYDDYMGGAGSFIELIQELQRQIENMVLDMNNAIKLTEKGKPNGVATLDANGKIPWGQLPSEMDAYIKHIPQTVYEHQVHGLRINNDGILEYESSPNTWTEVGFAEKQVGGSQTLEATVSVVNGIATITYTGIPTVAISKWSTGDKVTSHFTLNGTSFTGTTFNVSALGMHTLYYKDSNGIEYVKAFNVTSSMMNKPSLGIDIEDGFVTITPPTSPTISIKKWAKGSQPVSYFAFNGTTFTGNTFEVTEVGTYTIYIKTSTGLEYVYEINVAENMLKPPTPSIITTFSPSGSTALKYAYYVQMSVNDTSNVSKFEQGWSDNPNTEPSIYNQNYLAMNHSALYSTYGGLNVSKSPKNMYLHSKITDKSNNIIKQVSNAFNWGYNVASNTSTLSSLTPGNVFVIDGYDDGHFIVLEKNKNGGVYVVHMVNTVLRTWDTARTWADFDMNVGDTSKFDTTTTTAIGYHLNNVYYSGLPTALKNNIIARTWNTGSVDLMNPTIAQIEVAESATTINAKIGMPSYSELMKYASSNVLLNHTCANNVTSLTAWGANGRIHIGVANVSAIKAVDVIALFDKYTELNYTPSFILNNSTTVRKVTP